MTASGDTNLLCPGTNTKTTDTGLLNSVAIINANKEFIVQDCFAYIFNVFLHLQEIQYVYVMTSQSFIRAMTRDLEYPGTYGTLKAPDRYARAVLGPGTTDMFYCRDTTGLRNCTQKD